MNNKPEVAIGVAPAAVGSLNLSLIDDDDDDGVVVVDNDDAGNVCTTYILKKKSNQIKYQICFLPGVSGSDLICCLIGV